MGRPINASLHASWRARIEEQLCSGLTVAAFCLQSGIAVNNFYAWRRRLAPGAPQPESRRRAVGIAERPIPSTGRPVPTDGGAFIRIPLGPDANSLCLEAVLPDQTHLRVPLQHLAAWELTLRVIMQRAGGQPVSEVARV